MATSIFTKIIERKIPGQFVYEDDQCAVFLDKYPSVKGQSLVVPKEESDYAFALGDDLYHHLFSVAKKIAQASDRALNTERTCLVVEGFEIPHVHIKLYPMAKDDTSLAAALTPGEEAADEELEIVATQIRAAIEEDES